jgi:hypothetical protein
MFPKKCPTKFRAGGQWVATATHRKLWPTVENTLTTKNYTVLLYDET